MRITKISVIIFIFIFSALVIPQLGGADLGQSNVTDQPAARTDQVQVEIPEEKFYNASVMVDRNITIQLDSKVVLRDEITLQIHDNVTKLGYLNYSIPTVFTQYVHEIRMYSQFDDDIEVDIANNSREFTSYYGDEVTTFSIDIRENGFRANDSLEAVYIKTKLVAMDLIDFSLNGTGQRGVLTVPLTPMFPNLEVTNSKIGIGIQDSTHDEFMQDEIKSVENKLEEEMPEYRTESPVIEYFNMSRESYILFDDMLEKDFTRLVFTSTTPDSGGQVRVVVPTAVKQADRIVRIDPWGTVFVKEYIEIIHIGARRNNSAQIYSNAHKVGAILFQVSDTALVTDVYDELGSLELKGRSEDTGYPVSRSTDIRGKQGITVNFRSPIYGGESYGFTVEYRYNASDLLAIDTETGNHFLNATMFSDLNVTIWDMHVTYQLPSGGTFISHNYQPVSSSVDYSFTTNIGRKPMSAFRHLELNFHLSNATYLDITTFQIYYSYGGMGHFDYFASFSLLVMLLLGLVYFLSTVEYRPSKAIQIEREQVPVDEMDHFFNIFSEKTGAEKRLADLREKRKKGKISKKDYEGKIKAIRKRLRDITPELEKAAKALSDYGGRYESYVEKVMLASQRQTDIRRNARNTKKSYDRGEIPKNIYQKMMREYSMDLRKQESVVNKTLAEMVETIQKFNQ